MRQRKLSGRLKQKKRNMGVKDNTLWYRTVLFTPNIDSRIQMQNTIYVPKPV